MSPDALVLTGDLIDDGWFDGYEIIAGKLNERTFPSFILPGNSDDRAVMKSVLDGHYSSLMPSLRLIEPFTISIRLV
ncbi:3',5'-cyclic adenosine monophosphate phosphodiesterase CpdA [compost metagenome]